MTYDVDYFIAKFEAIPEDEWCVGHFISMDGTKCALGHCGDEGTGDSPEANALGCLFPYLGDVININDGRHSDYPQPTPKQRILAALNDIKKK
jgi:hypothetical protein